MYYNVEFFLHTTCSFSYYFCHKIQSFPSFSSTTQLRTSFMVFNVLHLLLLNLSATQPTLYNTHMEFDAYSNIYVLNLIDI